jgi:soluble lytic murein transglycosylase-like protein
VRSRLILAALPAATLALASPALAGAATGGGPRATLTLSIVLTRPALPRTTQAAQRSVAVARPAAGGLGSDFTSRPGPAVSVSLVLAVPGLPPVGLSPSEDSWLLPIWQEAAAIYGLPWQVLAAINRIESNNGRNMGPSSAGAIGWMQFMPSTWARYGLDVDGDGVANPWVARDAIHAAARYLAAAGARSDLPRAIFAYNHAWWYVDEVLTLARTYGWPG